MTESRKRSRSPDELRLVTYLAPGLPLALFEGIAKHLGSSLGLRVSLVSDEARSAPEPDGRDPFTTGAADLGFMCGPGYVWLSDRRSPAVELVPAAMVFDEPRCHGRPVYHADLVVSRHSRARSLAELAGARWVYNDPCSLSGYFSVLDALGRLERDAGFFGSARRIGSHHAALAAVARGEADCAAIDSNTLLLERRAGRLPAVRLVESFGPYPVQPVVARSGLPHGLKAAAAAALLAMHETEPGRSVLDENGVLRFAPIAPPDYEVERELLRRGDPSAPGCALAG